MSIIVCKWTGHVYINKQLQETAMKTIDLNATPILDTTPVRWNNFCKRFEGYVRVTRGGCIASSWMCTGKTEADAQDDMSKAMSQAMEFMSQY